MGMIKDFFQLIRAEHSLMVALAVLIGEVISLGELPKINLLIITALPPFFIACGAFAINDYFDLEVDRINKRMDRPLVRGKLKPYYAYTIALIFFIFGVSLAGFINLAAFVIAGVMAILAYLYSYKLKELFLLGNVYVAVAMGAPFIYGNLAVSASISTTAIIIAIIAFLTGLAREIVKTIQDMEGDEKARKAKTLPVVIGVEKSALCACVLYISAVFLSFFPFFFDPRYHNNLFYIIPILLANILFLFVAFKVISDQSKLFLHQHRVISLCAILIALVGFLLGAVWD